MTQKELWPVIGGRLGFVAFPGNGHEPAKCAPGAAQGLQACYDTYLLDFERAYFRTYNQNRLRNGVQGLQQRPPGMVANGQPARPVQRPTDPATMQLMLQHAHSTVQQMRAAGLQEELIALIERHRTQLQQSEQQRAQFRKGLSGQGMPQQPQQSNFSIPGAPQQSQFGQPPRDNGPAGMPQQQQQQPFGMSRQTNEQQGQQTFVHPGQHGHQQQQQQMAPRQAIMPPSQLQVQNAVKIVQKFKQDFIANRDPARVQQLILPDEQRLEYNQAFEQLLRIASDLDPKLPWIAVILKDEPTLRKLVVIVGSSLTCTFRLND